MSEDLHTAWDSNRITFDEIMQGLPAGDGQKWMVSGNLNPPSCLRRDRKTWLNSTVDPGPNLARLDPASWRKAEDRRTLELYKLFDG
jgi:hypothetical protein